MDPRILDITFQYVDEFTRIMLDAGTPPLDRSYVEGAVRELLDAYDPRVHLTVVAERMGLLEFVVRSPTSGNRYGMFFVDMGHVADAIAYWRDPPLYRDPAAALPHGRDRAQSLWFAARRLEDLR